MKNIHKYDDYGDYITHQKEKSLDPIRRTKWLNDEWQEKVDNFTRVFEQHGDFLGVGGMALCVCARTGQEVFALNQLGLDAIGIDIVPEPPLVIEGDMHDMDFKDESFDFVFSNSFDHSLYPEKFISEVERVLKRGGHALLQFQVGDRHDQYAENTIYSIDSVLGLYGSSDILVSQRICDPYFKSYDWEIVSRKCLT